METYASFSLESGKSPDLSNNKDKCPNFIQVFTRLSVTSALSQILPSDSLWDGLPVKEGIRSQRFGSKKHPRVW